MIHAMVLHLFLGCNKYCHVNEIRIILHFYKHLGMP
jgi:hypothetical protein